MEYLAVLYSMNSPPYQSGKAAYQSELSHSNIGSSDLISIFQIHFQSLNIYLAGYGEIIWSEIIWE